MTTQLIKIGLGLVASQTLGKICTNTVLKVICTAGEELTIKKAIPAAIGTAIISGAIYRKLDVDGYISETVDSVVELKNYIVQSRKVVKMEAVDNG